MVEYYVQWVVTEFVRDSFASVHATVFDCLVGMPGAWSVLRIICVYGDEGEMRGNVRTFMIHYAIQLGVRTYHKYMSWHVQHPVRYYYIIPFHGIPGIETVYMRTRDAQQREICEKIVTLLQQ
jgi:hypothetical protein